MKALLKADKPTVQIKDQQIRMLLDIAVELRGDMVFPTCFDVSIHLREVLSRPDSSLEEVGKAVSSDPLTSAKLVGMANSVAFNPGGAPKVQHLSAAILRLGLKNVRMVALSVAIKQLSLGVRFGGFDGVASSLWQHSVRAAAACQVIARRMTHLNSDEAFFVGLVHDLGAFYMLHRASHYEELRANPESLKEIVVTWHESLSESLLQALAVPEEIAEATREHDRPRPLPQSLSSLEDVLGVAIRLIGTTSDQLLPIAASRTTTPEIEPYLALLPEILAVSKALLATLR